MTMYEIEYLQALRDIGAGVITCLQEQVLAQRQQVDQLREIRRSLDDIGEQIMRLKVGPME
jgi:hypothetical protein